MTDSHGVPRLHLVGKEEFSIEHVPDIAGSPKYTAIRHAALDFSSFLPGHLTDEQIQLCVIALVQGMYLGSVRHEALTVSRLHELGQRVGAMP